MTTFAHPRIDVIADVPREASRRCRPLLAASVAVLWALAVFGSSIQLRAQANAGEQPGKGGLISVPVLADNLLVTHGGMNIRKTIQGSGLDMDGSYAPRALQREHNGCIVDYLELSTDDGWTLVSGPAGTGVYPRCADVVTPPDPGWGSAVNGSFWIGPNPGGTSGGGGDQDVYIYRRYFCVDTAGTYMINIAAMADDMADASLDGLPLFTLASPGWASVVSAPFSVPLTRGCHWFEFRVVDIGGVVTGLDAFISIQGPALLTKGCCDCAFCRIGP